MFLVIDLNMTILQLLQLSGTASSSRENLSARYRMRGICKSSSEVRSCGTVRGSCPVENLGGILHVPVYVSDVLSMYRVVISSNLQGPAHLAKTISTFQTRLEVAVGLQLACPRFVVVQLSLLVDVRRGSL